MSSPAAAPAKFDLSSAKVFYNLPVAELIEHALRKGEGKLASNGALVSYTGKYTGRTPKDKYVVREPDSEANIWWDNNAPMEPEVFERLRQKAYDYMAGQELYVIDTYGGADPYHRIKARFIVQSAYHAH